MDPLPENPRLIECVLAERYLPAPSPEAMASHAERDRIAAAAMSIGHIQTIYVPADETCFALFQAPSPELVTRTSDLFELGYRRVVPAIAVASPPPEANDAR